MCSAGLGNPKLSSLWIAGELLIKLYLIHLFITDPLIYVDIAGIEYVTNYELPYKLEDFVLHFSRINVGRLHRLSRIGNGCLDG